MDKFVLSLSSPVFNIDQQILGSSLAYAVYDEVKRFLLHSADDNHIQGLKADPLQESEGIIHSCSTVLLKIKGTNSALKHIEQSVLNSKETTVLYQKKSTEIPIQKYREFGQECSQK